MVFIIQHDRYTAQINWVKNDTKCSVKNEAISYKDILLTKAGGDLELKVEKGGRGRNLKVTLCHQLWKMRILTNGCRRG